MRTYAQTFHAHLLCTLKAAVSTTENSFLCHRNEHTIIRYYYVHSSAWSNSVNYNCMQCANALLLPQNDHIRVDSDFSETQNALYRTVLAYFHHCCMGQ